MKPFLQNGTLEEFDDQIGADANHAQLLMQIGPNTRTFEEAKQIIEETGVHITEMKPLPANWILLKLDVKDMRNIAFKLIENGFSNIKGINAINIKV